MRLFGAAAVAIGLLLAPLASAETFGRPAEIPLAKEPDGVLLLDANQDGNIDIVTISSKSAVISVLAGLGDGRFERRTDLPGISGARAAVFGDWDADGSDDLAVAAGGKVTIFSGQDGGLALQTSYPVQTPGALAAGDADGDGLLDLVTSSLTTPTVSLLRGRGDQTFEPAVDFPIGDLATSVLIADPSDDEVPDILAAGSDLSILVGVGDGSFEPYRSFAGGLGARSLAADDLDDDADADLVVSLGQNQVGVLLNAGEGSYPDLVTYRAGGTPVGASIRDVDGDGYVDVLTANRSSDDVSLLSGRGDGTFAPQLRVKVGRAPTGLGLEDLNEDGELDVVTANRRSKSVTVLMNGLNAPQPTICLVPRVVRRRLAVAKTFVRRAHCTVSSVRRKYSARVKRGRVISTTPAVGTRLPPGSRIGLLVSRGPRR